MARRAANNVETKLHKLAAATLLKQGEVLLKSLHDDFSEPTYVSYQYKERPNKHDIFHLIVSTKLHCIGSNNVSKLKKAITSRKAGKL